MKDIIKELIQSHEVPLVFTTNTKDQLQELYLFRINQEITFEGHTVPQGTHILTTKHVGMLYEDICSIDIISDEPITAFVLPYISNNIGEITLDSSADLVVTRRLTGCTVVAELNTPTPQLLHINRLKENNGYHELDQAAIDLDIDKISDKQLFTLKKDDYNFDNIEKCMYAATFIGIREQGSWNYYSQYTEYNNTNGAYKIVQGKQAVTTARLSAMSITNTRPSYEDISSTNTQDEQIMLKWCNII